MDKPRADMSKKKFKKKLIVINLVVLVCDIDKNNVTITKIYVIAI